MHILSKLFEFLSIFNWRIITLQYCIGFCHTSTWISHRYTYVPSLLKLSATSHPFLPLLVVAEPQFEFLELCSKIPSAIYFTYGSVYVRRRQWHPTPVLLPGKIPWMEESGRLQSMGSLRVGHDWATSLSLFTFMHWKGTGNPLHCSCLENPRDGGACWAAVYGVAQSRTRLKWLSSSSSVYVSMLLSPFILPSPSYPQPMFISLFSMSVSPWLPCK